MAGLKQWEVVVVATKRLRQLLIALIVLFTNIGHSFAEMMSKGKTKVKSILNLYHQNSDGGDQVYDNSKREETNVVEPMIFIEHQITEDTALTAHFVLDLWTAASDTKLDSQTGASGESGIQGQARFSGNLGLRTEKGKWTFGSQLGMSSEYDYRSLNGSLNVSRSFAKDNFTLGFGLQYYLDEVSLFKDLTPAALAQIQSGQSRKILATSLSASQILTRKDIAFMTLNYIKASGHLESTASSVSVNNQREVEILPGSRDRYAATLGWVHALSETSALHSNYRYYWDDWQLSAHTLKMAYLWEYNDEEDFFEIALRYHQQSQVEYFKPNFTQAMPFMTSDSDLERFRSSEVSLFHTKKLFTQKDVKILGLTFSNIHWSNGVTYAERSNGLRYAYVQSGFTFEF